MDLDLFIFCVFCLMNFAMKCYTPIIVHFTKVPPPHHLSKENETETEREMKAIKRKDNLRKE